MNEKSDSFDLVVFGEILYDRFPDGSSVLGGAPFNVAWNLRGLGANPLLISRVGADAAGAGARQAMAGWGLADTGVQADRDHATGEVAVTLTAGEPEFAIEPERAYDFIAAESIPPTARELPIVYHGTLALRHAESRRALDALLETGGTAVFLDLNLRAPWWRAEDLPWVAEQATWIKLNRQELNLLGAAFGLADSPPEQKAEKLRAHCGAELVVVTLGGDGALAVGRGHDPLRLRPEGSIDVVDTVGAGDAFSAVLLLGLIRGWELATALERAGELAGAVCGLRGAISRDPGFYRNFRENWRT